MVAKPMRNRAEGFTLIEILVALLVLTLGLLGLAGMQMMAQRSEVESYQRAQAMVIMSDIVDRLNTNRKAASCYAITTSTSAGTPFIGAAGAGKYDVSGFSCPALATNPTAVTRAAADMEMIEDMLLGVTEVSGGASVGAMIGARACIGFDATSQSYTVAVAWQGVTQTFSPASWDATINPAVARNGALNLYGTDTQRRVVWTTILIASLS
jgi:type IV pilus assembly protein PilV